MTRHKVVRGRVVSIHIQPVMDFFVARCRETDTSHAGDTEYSAVTGLLEALSARFSKEDRALSDAPFMSTG